MQTKTLIRDSTQIVRVTEMTEGSAYRRVIPRTSYSEAKIAYGVVTGVLSNGETAVITALEVTGERHVDARIDSKTFEGDTDLVLFPVDHDEMIDVLDAAGRGAETTVDRQRRELDKAITAQERLVEVSARIRDGADLSATTVETGPQSVEA